MNDRTFRIRRLTPREYFSLMGFDMSDADKCSALGESNSQLYKQAGNGIVTNCVMLLMEHLYKSQYDPDFKCGDEGR